MLPRPRRNRSLLLALAALALAGCSAGGGSGHGSTTASAATGLPGGSSPVSAAQWQTALAAIGGAGASYVPPTPACDDAGFARWNVLIARCWPGLEADVDPLLLSSVTSALSGFTSGIAAVTGVRSVTLDTTAAPAFAPTGSPTRMQLDLPAAPGTWRLDATLDVDVSVSTTIAGFPITAALSGDLTVSVQGLSVAVPVEFDFTNPREPKAVAIDTPTVALTLTLSSTTPLIQQLTSSITQVLQPVVQTAILAAVNLAPSQVSSTLAYFDVPTWGAGGPGPAAVTAPADLRAQAEAISDEIQRVHLPFGTIVGTRFDQPGVGQGSVVAYQDYGDSAIWTGSYLASEVLRYEQTGDPRALAGASRALDGLNACLDIAGPQGGLLGRCVIPLSSPSITDISGASDYYVGVHNGVTMGGIGSISRDQYIGAMLGFSQAMLRVPALRPTASALIGRVVAYLDGQDWIARDHNSGVVTAPFGETPDIVWGFLSAANLADRATFATLHDSNVALPRVAWLSAWLSARDQWTSYFKYNLGHETTMILVSCETDPATYREHLKALEVVRDVVEGHDNAWFDAVYAIAVPTAAPALGPRIETELQRWCLRPRRDFSVNNSADPSIVEAANPRPDPGAAPMIAQFAVPVEKRPSGDFLWQTSPFDLDGSGNPYLEQPGVDLVLPYWAARSFGIVK
jgi:hypothetical protein